MLKTVAIIIFILTYILLLSLPKIKPYVALGAGAIFIIIGILPLSEVLGALDFNVLMMIAGTMGLVSLFIKSGMPAFLADLIIAKSGNVCVAVVGLSVFAGFISAFVDNVATVLMIAPVAIAVAKKLNISPVMPIISISIFSNLQGAATLVGDTTSIMLGGALDMSFLDFFVYNGKMGMFFVVEISAIVATFILYFYFRKEKEKIEPFKPEKVTYMFPTYLLLAMLALLIGASFIQDKPDVTSGAICCILAIIGIVVDCIRDKSLHPIKEVWADIDYQTLLLLVGLFLVIGGIEYVGVISDIANFIAATFGDNIFLLYTVIVWGSMLISAFIDNIPYVATMLPVVAGIAASLGVDPTVLYFGLLTGATLGGNITPIGASANVAAIGILRKEGHEVPTGTFMKLSVPITIAAVATGYLIVWLVFGVAI